MQEGWHFTVSMLMSFITYPHILLYTFMSIENVHEIINLMVFEITKEMKINFKDLNCAFMQSLLYLEELLDIQFSSNKYVILMVFIFKMSSLYDMQEIFIFKRYSVGIFSCHRL